MELETQFQQAMERVQQLPEKPDNATLLQHYIDLVAELFQARGAGTEPK